MPIRARALSAVLLPVVLCACSRATTSAGASTTAPPATPPAATTTPTPAASIGAPAGAPVRKVTITVRGGRPSGAPGRVRVEQGARVRLTVLADVADEVHVHGFDLMRDTTPGTPAVVEFVADRTGVFEVELERSRVLLTRLQVQ